MHFLLFCQQEEITLLPYLPFKIHDSQNGIIINLSENIEIIAKKAFGGLKNLTSIVCYPGTKFEKNSLKGTSEELTIMLTFPKDSTKKERRAAKKALMKQLKKAGNKNAKIVVVISE